MNKQKAYWIPNMGQFSVIYYETYFLSDSDNLKDWIENQFGAIPIIIICCKTLLYLSDTNLYELILWKMILRKWEQGNCQIQIHKYCA